MINKKFLGNGLGWSYKEDEVKLAGFDSSQTRDADGKWGSDRGSIKGCHEEAKVFDDYMSYEDQVKKQLDYTTYGPNNEYKKSRWVDWFLGSRQENKNAIAYDINSDPELERALKSNLYHFWKKESASTDKEKEISFKDFQKSTIKLYRGVSHKNIEDATIHQNGFTSYALMRGLAEKWSAKGEVREYDIKVSDLYGSVNVVGGEIEVLEPQPYSNEFASQIFRESHDDLFKTDFIEDPKGWKEYRKIKEEKGAACAYMYSKRYIKENSSVKLVDQVSLKTIDGKKAYKTKEEAKKVAKEMGCDGYHEHKVDDVVYFMPCKSHDQIKK